MTDNKIYWVPGRSYIKNSVEHILIRTVGKARWLAAVLNTKEECDNYADLVIDGVGYSVGCDLEAPEPTSKKRASAALVERLAEFIDEIAENEAEGDDEEEEEEGEDGEEGEEDDGKKDERKDGKKDEKKDGKKDEKTEEKEQQEEPKRHQKIKNLSMSYELKTPSDLSAWEKEVSSFLDLAELYDFAEQERVHILKTSI